MKCPKCNNNYVIPFQKNKVKKVQCLWCDYCDVKEKFLMERKDTRCTCGKRFSQKDLFEYRQLDHCSSYPRFNCPKCNALIKCTLIMNPSMKIDEIITKG